MCCCQYVPPCSSADDAILAACLELLSVSTEAKTVLYSYTSSVLPLHFHWQKGLLISKMMIRVSLHRAVHSACRVNCSHHKACCPTLVAGLKGICSFVFEREDDFPQILDFTGDMSQQYGLNVHKLHADFRSGIEGLLETTKLKAIILGTRR